MASGEIAGQCRRVMNAAVSDEDVERDAGAAFAVCLAVGRAYLAARQQHLPAADSSANGSSERSANK